MDQGVDLQVSVEGILGTLPKNLVHCLKFCFPLILSNENELYVDISGTQSRHGCMHGFSTYPCIQVYNQLVHTQ